MAQKIDSKQPSENNLDINKIMKIAKNDDELAKTMLARLSGADNAKPKKNDPQYDFLDSLSKPAWIDSVKKTQKIIIDPQIQKKEDIITQLKPVKIQGAVLNIESEKNEKYSKDYPYFSIVKRIMYANGDSANPNDESVIIMHNAISRLLDTVFDSQLVHKYMDHESKIGKKSEKTPKNKASKFKKFLSKIYPQEYFKYFQFTRIAKNVEKLDFDLEHDQEVDESKLFNYESDNDDDDGLSFKLLNSNIKEDERSHFNHQRMEKMNEDEYLNFVNCRSTNFLSDGKEKFVSFLDLDRRGFGFLAKNKNIIEFLGYIMTRKVGSTVENILRKHNNGVLKELPNSISVSDIEEETNKQLNSLKTQLRKVVRDSMSIEEVAFRLFQKEYKELEGEGHTYEVGEKPSKTSKSLKREDSIVSQVSNDSKSETKNEASIQEEQASGNSKASLKAEWRKLNVATRKQWIDRVLGEKQVKELIELHGDEIKDWDDVDPVNSYAEYLINNIKLNKDKSKIDDNLLRELFRRYRQNGALVLNSQNAGPEEKVNEENAIVVEKKEEPSTLQNGSTKPTNTKKRRLESIFE